MTEDEKNLFIFFHVFCHAVKYIREDISFDLPLNIIDSSNVSIATHLKWSENEVKL